MNAQELYDAFRIEMFDSVKPYLWTDDEVLAYEAEAYDYFVRLTGGIPDFTSDATKIPVVAGEAVGEMHPSILRIMSATLASNGRNVGILNSPDVPQMRSNDYGQSRPSYPDSRPGEVQYMVIGMEDDKCKWLGTPMVDDEVQLVIYRLPLVPVEDFIHTLSEIKKAHHRKLLIWMKALAFRKEDADTFNRTKAEENESLFEKACAGIMKDKERMKHKTRVVSYGGL